MLASEMLEHLRDLVADKVVAPGQQRHFSLRSGNPSIAARSSWFSSAAAASSDGNGVELASDSSVHRFG